MFDWTHEELPQPTTDVATLQSNIDEFGYCLVAEAIAPEQLAIAKQRLLEQAQAELEGGHAFEDGGAKQQWGAFTDKDGNIRRDAFSAKSGRRQPARLDVDQQGAGLARVAGAADHARGRRACAGE